MKPTPVWHNLKRKKSIICLKMSSYQNKLSFIKCLEIVHTISRIIIINTLKLFKDLANIHYVKISKLINNRLTNKVTHSGITYNFKLIHLDPFQMNP